MHLPDDVAVHITSVLPNVSISFEIFNLKPAKLSVLQATITDQHMLHLLLRWRFFVDLDAVCFHRIDLLHKLPTTAQFRGALEGLLLRCVKGFCSGCIEYRTFR